jgi:protocatechuate 3,4-dioxygenase beta subunit
MSPEGVPLGSGPPASLLAVLVKEGDVVRKTLRMARGLSVTGRVTGPDGAPVAEARVTRSGGDGTQAIWQWGVSWNGSPGAGVATDAEGRFRLDAIRRPTPSP